MEMRDRSFEEPDQTSFSVKVGPVLNYNGDGDVSWPR